MIPADGIINVQGDQPFVDPQEILNMNEHLSANHSVYQVITPCKVYERDHPYAKDPNKVKVVTAKCGRALYFLLAMPSAMRELESTWESMDTKRGIRKIPIPQTNSLGSERKSGTTQVP